MMNTQEQGEALLAQVLEIQDRMVRRAQLPAARAHEVADGYFTVLGTTVIHCSCGEWIDRPDEESQLAYGAHVATALGLRVRWSRAA